MSPVTPFTIFISYIESADYHDDPLFRDTLPCLQSVKQLLAPSPSVLDVMECTSDLNEIVPATPLTPSSVSPATMCDGNHCSYRDKYMDAVRYAEAQLRNAGKEHNPYLLDFYRFSLVCFGAGDIQSLITYSNWVPDEAFDQVGTESKTPSPHAPPLEPIHTLMTTSSCSSSPPPLESVHTLLAMSSSVAISSSSGIKIPSPKRTHSAVVVDLTEEAEDLYTDDIEESLPTVPLPTKRRRVHRVCQPWEDCNCEYQGAPHSTHSNSQFRPWLAV